VARRPLERERISLDGGRRTTQLMRDSLDGGDVAIRLCRTMLVRQLACEAWMSQMSPDDDPHGVYLRLSAQRALWGNVPHTLRAASVERQDTRIRCRFIFDGAASEEDRETVSLVGAHILSDYPPQFTLDEEFLELQAPGEMTHLQYLVFLRFER
jgi:hypothetical protein